MRVWGLIAACLWPSAAEVVEVGKIAARYQLSREVVLDDGTRCDLMSPAFAIECEWSDKFAESIGQALHYSIKTGKQPGIVLIRRTETSEELHARYLERCRAVCERHGITLWQAVEGDDTVTKVYPPDPFH